MKLIDFGSSKKLLSRKFRATYTEFNDPSDIFHRVYRDLFGMGVIIKYLFPELDDSPRRNSKKSPNQIMIEKAIKDLADALMNSDKQSRCTSEDALNYCNALIKNLNKPNPELLKEIASSTINRSTTTVEDVLRGVKRSV